MTRSFKQLAVALSVALAAAIIVPAMTAFGHAGYDHSTPNKDEVVATAPTQIEAFFAEEIAAETGTYYLRVEDSSGTQVSDGDGTLSDDDRTLITATFPSPLANGMYIVRWQTTSFEDRDSDGGAFCFFVVDQPTADQTAECAALAEEEPTAVATGGETPGTTPAATSMETPSGTAAASPTATSDSEDDDDDSNTGIIIGIIVAVAAVVVVGGGVALYMRQRQ